MWSSLVRLQQAGLLASPRLCHPAVALGPLTFLSPLPGTFFPRNHFCYLSHFSGFCWNLIMSVRLSLSIPKYDSLSILGIAIFLWIFLHLSPTDIYVYICKTYVFVHYLSPLISYDINPMRRLTTVLFTAVFPAHKTVLWA